jgi:AcrR family transcriptional regulator
VGSAGEPTRRRARRSDSVRNASLVTKAAIELFAEHGMDVTLAQVAERAGVGKATVYRTYASREEMVAAMLDHRLAWLRRRMELALAHARGGGRADEPGGFQQRVVASRRRPDARRLRYLSSRSRGITYYIDR